MADGLAQLDAHIARIRALPKALAYGAAPEVARAVEIELQRTIAAGTTPDGEPWTPTKTGEKPLTHAAGALAVVAVGTRVFVRLRGPEALHHKGWARSGKVRKIIPTDSIPQPMAAAITKVLAQRFDKAVKP